MNKVGLTENGLAKYLSTNDTRVSSPTGSPLSLTLLLVNSISHLPTTSYSPFAIVTSEVLSLFTNEMWLITAELPRPCLGGAGILCWRYRSERTYAGKVIIELIES